jgi:hypothetical protein
MVATIFPIMMPAIGVKTTTMPVGFSGRYRHRQQAEPSGNGGTEGGLHKSGRSIFPEVGFCENHVIAEKAE